MNVLIIGATRGIGFELLKRALERGHAVTALARNPDKIPEQHGRLKVFKGDILDFESVKRATLDQDAVCCCIGTGVTRKLVTVFSQGTKHVLDAMREADVRRLICITGVGAGNSKNHGGFLYDKIFQPLLLKSIYDDKDRQEEQIITSNVEWIIVRPGFLTNGPARGQYQVLTELTGVTARQISRADVAEFMLDQLTSDQYLRQSPLLTY